MALKAKILLFNASPLYNDDQPYYDGSSEAEREGIVWHGGFKQERWQRALQACKDFFEKNPDADLQVVFAVLDDGILALGQQTLDEIAPEYKQ